MENCWGWRWIDSHLTPGALEHYEAGLEEQVFRVMTIVARSLLSQYTFCVLSVIWTIKLQSSWDCIHFTEEKMKLKVTCPWPLSDLNWNVFVNIWVGLFLLQGRVYLSWVLFATRWCLLSLVTVCNASSEQCNCKPQVSQPYLPLLSNHFPCREN